MGAKSDNVEYDITALDYITVFVIMNYCSLAKTQNGTSNDM